MVDKPNYKKDLTPEQYEVCWNTKQLSTLIARLAKNGLA